MFKSVAIKNIKKQKRPTAFLHFKGHERSFSLSLNFIDRYLSKHFSFN